jgi:Phage tail tube protein
MVNSPSLGLLAVHSAEYVEEASYGVFPTNPTMSWIGTDMEYSDSADMGSIIIRNIGKEDVTAVTLGAQAYEVDLQYAPQTSAFAKYMVNSQGGGSGSIDESLSLLIAPKISGTPEYIQALGCRPDSGSISWQLGKEIMVKMKLIAQSIAAYSSTDPVGTGAHSSDPGTNPWIFTDPGASGITIGGTAYDLQDLTASFNRNLQKIRALGQGTVKYLPAGVRDITFDVTIMLEATSNYSALLANSAQTIVATLKSGTSVLTLSNAFFQKQAKSIKVGDVTYEKYSGVAETASLT